MNKFLQSAAERYPKELNSQLIHPINAIDAEIIGEIIDILKKLEFIEITLFLDQYKYLKDSEIRNVLKQWNIDHPADGELGKEDVIDKKPKKSGLDLLFRRNFIFFKNFRLELSRITSYEKQDEYNFVLVREEYKIIINALPETTNIVNSTSNKIISYTDIEQRDRDFEALDTYMENFPGIHFINKRE
jgi:isocitrate/isopropylmalate dehydrogenase